MAFCREGSDCVRAMLAGKAGSFNWGPMPSMSIAPWVILYCISYCIISMLYIINENQFNALIDIWEAVFEWILIPSERLLVIGLLEKVLKAGKSPTFATSKAIIPVGAKFCGDYKTHQTLQTAILTLKVWGIWP